MSDSPTQLARALSVRHAPRRGRRASARRSEPPQQLAEYLAGLAPARPLGNKAATLPRGNRMMLDEATGNDGELRRSYQRQRQVWALIGRQFPGKVMPAPNLTRKGKDETSWGYYRQAGEPVGWVDLHPSTARKLVSPVDAADEYGQKTQRFYESAALETLLHEWAHALQKPGLGFDPTLAEGGADIYGHVMRPMVARELGMPGDTTPMAYPKQAQRTLQRKGLAWALRGQFR